MVKKRRRKDLKQPDEFVNYTMKIGQWVREHQRLVVFISAVVVVGVLAFALTMTFIESSHQSSSALLWDAIEIASAPVVDPDDEDTADIPEKLLHYDSIDDRTKAATKAFEKVIDAHGSSTSGKVARLGLASSKLAKGEYAEARQLYEDFVNDSGDLDSLKSIAVEGIGLCFEGQKNYDQALETFRNLEKLDNGDHQDLAKYHQARMLEKLNKRDAAADLYRGIVRRREQATDEMVTNLWVSDRSEARLAVIDPGADVLKNRSKNRGSDLLKQIMGGRGGAGGPINLPSPPGGSKRD